MIKLVTNNLILHQWKWKHLPLAKHTVIELFFFFLLPQACSALMIYLDSDVISSAHKSNVLCPGKCLNKKNLSNLQGLTANVWTCSDENVGNSEMKHAAWCQRLNGIRIKCRWERWNIRTLLFFLFSFIHDSSREEEKAEVSETKRNLCSAARQVETPPPPTNPLPPINSHVVYIIR